MRLLKIPLLSCFVFAAAGPVRGASINMSSRAASDFASASPNHALTDNLLDTFTDDFSYTDPNGNYSASLTGHAGLASSSVYRYTAAGGTSAANGGTGESSFADLVYFGVDQITPFTLAGDFEFTFENSPLEPRIDLLSQSGDSTFTPIDIFKAGSFSYSGTLSPGFQYSLRIEDGAYAGGSTGISTASYSANVVLSVPEPSALATLGLAGMALLKRRRS